MCRAAGKGGPRGKEVPEQEDLRLEGKVLTCCVTLSAVQRGRGEGTAQGAWPGGLEGGALPWGGRLELRWEG